MIYPRSLARGLLALPVALSLSLSFASSAYAQQQGPLKQATSSQGSSDEQEQGGVKETAVSKYYFQLEALNAGLGELPAGLDLETPRSAVESFVSLGKGGEYGKLAHAMDLRELPPEQQREQGEELARKLLQIIDRKVMIRWDDLADRPDGLNEFVSTKNPMAGEPRRSVRLEQLELDDRPVSIRLHRIKPGDAEPIWVFSRQTVGHIKPLHERYGPTKFEGWLPDGVKKTAFRGVQWWEVIAFPLFILLAFATGWATYKGVSVLTGRLEHERPSKLLKRARAPAALFVGVLVAKTLMQSFFTFSATINTFLRPLIIGALILGGLLVVVRIIDAFLDTLERQELGDKSIDDEENVDLRRRYTNIYAARRIILLLVGLIGVGIILVETDIFQALGISILATAGVASLILGLAAQEMLGDIISSLQIAIAKPVHIGDSVHYEGDWAYVEAVHYTFVVLRTWDLRRLIVPVKYFVSHPFENWSKKDPRMVRMVSLVLDHTADVDELREHWARIAKADEDVDGEDWIKTLVMEHGKEGMTVQFYCASKDPTTAWHTHCRLREQMLAYIRDERREWAVTRVLNVGEHGDDTATLSAAQEL